MIFFCKEVASYGRMLVGERRRLRSRFDGPWNYYFQFAPSNVESWYMLSTNHRLWFGWIQFVPYVSSYSMIIEPHSVGFSRDFFRFRFRTEQGEPIVTRHLQVLYPSQSNSSEEVVFLYSHGWDSIQDIGRIFSSIFPKIKSHRASQDHRPHQVQECPMHLFSFSIRCLFFRPR